MGDLHFSHELDTGLLSKGLSSVFGKGESVAVKLHYGEKGNRTSLAPGYAKAIVSALKALGANPFLFDSSVMYGGLRSEATTHRKSAELQGFTEKTIGCPMVFTEGIVKVKTPSLEAEVCRPLAEADGMVVLSHVKGHPCCGFGAAIKNLGMGGVSKKTKKDIHSFSKVEYIGGCEACGLCEKICPAGLELGKNGPEISSCWGCNACEMHCPKNCFRIKVKPFDTLISEGALAVVRSVKKAYYVNVMKSITKYCDCMSNPGEIIAPDSGILYGTDIVSIDKASMDIINRNAGCDIFGRVHHKPALGHIQEAGRLAMGSINYTLGEA